MTGVGFVEVGPRDGLQNEAAVIGTSDKLALITRAIAAGARRIEVASFVNPARVPQMADAEAVCAGLPERADVTYIGLALNRRGADRALATGRIDQVGAVAVASDAFGIANQSQTSDASVKEAQAIVAAARAAGRSGQVTIAAAFGCPFSGPVDPGRVVAMAARLAEAAPCEIALADTIGAAAPNEVADLVARVRAAIHPLPVRVHFHNTRGTGLANVWAAINAGAATVDGAIGGIGGCPFAPGAAGNVASEDVIYMLERSGIDTGMNLAALVDTSQWLGGIMGRALPGMVARAPAFPAATSAGVGA
mgnify:CR=1 FL=1